MSITLAGENKYRAECLNLDNLVDLVEDTKVCYLHSIEYRKSAEGKPFVRLRLSDIHGRSVTGRYFMDDYKGHDGTFLTNRVGTCLIMEFRTSFVYGLSLTVTDIKVLNSEIVEEVSKNFSAVCDDVLAAEMAVTAKITKLVSGLSDDERACIMTNCMIAELRNVSLTDVCNGETGAVLRVLDMFMQLSESAVIDTRKALLFLSLVSFKYKTDVNSEVAKDNSVQRFIAASVAFRVIMEAVPGFSELREFVSDCTALLSDTATSTTPDAQLIYSLFAVCLQHANDTSAIKFLPKDGFVRRGRVLLRK